MYFDLPLLRAPGPRSQLLGRGDDEAGIGALGPAAVYSEIARLKGRVSTFGDQLDTFADWLVHTAFYATLGVGVARADGQELWLGLAAAAGCTIDYFSRIVTGMRSKRAGSAPSPGKGEIETRKARFKYVFRVLVRTDFCFIVLPLAVIDATWVLLPAGAVGAQAYWVLRFFRYSGDNRCRIGRGRPARKAPCDI